MAFWGVALSCGITINSTDVDDESAKTALESLKKAEAASEQSSLELELIHAQNKRFALPSPKNRDALNAAYADAMREVWHRHRNDPDVGALFAEALIDEKPWKQWNLNGTAAPGTQEALDTLHEVLLLNPMHPQALHMTIHAMESSPHPEKALDAANKLLHLQRDLGHMEHMPSHIYARMGMWKKAVDTNINAIAVTNAYEKSRGYDPKASPNVDHYGEMLAYEASMIGQSKVALDAISIKGFTPEWLGKNAADLDGDLAMPMEILQRFGKWSEILATPEFPPTLPISRTLRAGARAVAFAATNHLAEAKAELSRFALLARAIPAKSDIGLNKQGMILEVERHLIMGEILIHQPRNEVKAIHEMRLAVKLNDNLLYTEPPDWLLPPRHPLGAALLLLGRYKDAEQVFRDDLFHLPHNGWSLLGLSKALRAQGKLPESARALAEFKVVWKDADININTSCLCLQPKPR